MPIEGAIFSQEINLGAYICSLIKQIYYPDKPWIDCREEVSRKFTVFKNIARDFYPQPKDKNVELLNNFKGFSIEDVKDIFSFEKPHHANNTDKRAVNDGKYDVTWVPIPNKEFDKKEEIRKLLLAVGCETLV